MVHERLNVSIPLRAPAGSLADAPGRRRGLA